MIPPEMARGLRMLRTFEGRDSRRQFWIYAAGLFVVTFALSFVLNVAVVALAFLVGPDAIVPVLAPVILTLTAVLAVATVGLHAAAVTRRLHDRGHTVNRPRFRDWPEATRGWLLCQHRGSIRRSCGIER